MSRKVSRKKRDTTITVVDDGIEWAPLSDIKQTLKSKGMGRTMPRLIKTLREELNIKCEKKFFKDIIGNQEIWAITKPDYDFLTKLYKTVFYLIHLHPEGDGSCRLLIKMGFSKDATNSRSPKYKTMAPNNKIIWQAFLPEKYERHMMNAAKGLAIPYGGSDELFVMLKEENLEKIKEELEKWYAFNFPKISARHLDMDDFRYDAVSNSYIPKHAPEEIEDNDDSPSETTVLLPRIEAVPAETPAEMESWREQLRGWRLVHGLKQREVAPLLEVKAQKTISRWEMGISTPSRHMLEKIKELISNPLPSSQQILFTDEDELTWNRGFKGWFANNNLTHKNIAELLFIEHGVEVSSRSIGNYLKDTIPKCPRMREAIANMSANEGLLRRAV